MKSSVRFFKQIALLMGLPEVEGFALSQLQLVRGAEGLLCRLRHRRVDDEVQAWPEILLPLAVQDIQGPSVQRLLVLQEALYQEFRWRIGLAADEDLLQLSPVDWADTPQGTVAALALGQTLGRSTLDELQALGLNARRD